MRPLALALASALALVGCSTPTEDGLPDSIAVLGDSISRAVNVKGDSFGEYPANGWATGADPADGVESHFERFRALDPALDIVAFNNAKSGAKVDDLRRQAEEAERQRATYVVILIGANDACSATPTPVLGFHAGFVAAAEVLDRMGAKVYVASVPDVAHLVDLYGDNATARAVWDAFDVCPGVVSPDVDLEEVRTRIRAYDDLLEGQATARGWAWDGGAVFDTAFKKGDVSAVDFFHPSLEGQAALAEATWNAGPYAGE